MSEPAVDQPSYDVAAVADQYYGFIRNICRARLPTHSDADDATQETLMRFVQADHTNITHPVAWLTTVAVRVCAAWHRQRYAKPEVAMDDSRQSSDSRQNVADVVTDRVWLAQVASLLPASDYRLLHSLYVQRLGTAHVARALGTTEGNVRVLSFRARQRAAQLLAPFHQDSGELAI